MKCKECNEEFKEPRVIDCGCCHLNLILVCPKCDERLEED